MRTERSDNPGVSIRFPDPPPLCYLLERIMKEHRLLVAAASLLFASARVALAHGAHETVPAEADSAVSEEPAKTCFPPCRTGYVCHPDTLECVSICNPPCANWGMAPGFQIFLAERFGLVFEVGYARSWFKIGSSVLKNIKVGQATLRFGFTVPL